MHNFEWIQPLDDAEMKELAKYKNLSFDLNDSLRRGTTPANCAVLDAAILKGRCLCEMQVFRAIRREWLQVLDDGSASDPGYLSTSARYQSVGDFLEGETPAILVINCPAGTAMAAFDYDEGLGEEAERLLPRGLNLRVIRETRVPNSFDLLREESALNFHYTSSLESGASIAVVELEIVRPITGLLSK